MSVIWSGVTEEGAVVPVQVTDEGKVVAVGDGPQGDYLPISGGTLTGDLNVADGISLRTDGSAQFVGDVKIGGTLPDAPNLKLNKDGYIIYKGGNNSTIILQDRSGNDYNAYLYGFNASGIASYIVRRDGTTLIGGDLTNIPATESPNITLNANGNIGGRTLTAQTESDSFGCLITKNLAGQNTSTIYQDGRASFASGLISGDGKTTSRHFVDAFNISFPSESQGTFNLVSGATDNYSGVTRTTLNANGSAEFSGDVVIGSRGEKWLIRESNGVAMLVQQSREAAPMIPEKVRDIPSELDLIEMALNEVMEKLRMTPPAGWPVWDGSDNP